MNSSNHLLTRENSKAQIPPPIKTQQRTNDMLDNSNFSGPYSLMLDSIQSRNKKRRQVVKSRAVVRRLNWDYSLALDFYLMMMTNDPHLHFGLKSFFSPRIYSWARKIASIYHHSLVFLVKYTKYWNKKYLQSSSYLLKPMTHLALLGLEPSWKKKLPRKRTILLDRCASVLAWSCMAERWPAQLVIDLFG